MFKCSCGEMLNMNWMFCPNCGYKIKSGQVIGGVMNTDNEKIKKIIKLSNENPELPIVTIVATEIVAEDSFVYWMSRIGEIRKDIILKRNEYITIGYDDIFDFLSCEIENNTYDKELTEDEIKELTEARIEELKSWKDIYEAIIIYIELPEGL